MSNEEQMNMVEILSEELGEKELKIMELENKIKELLISNSNLIESLKEEGERKEEEVEEEILGELVYAFGYGLDSTYENRDAIVRAVIEDWKNSESIRIDDYDVCGGR